MSSLNSAALRPHTRRAFLSLTALLGVGASLSACSHFLPPRPDAALQAFLSLADRDRKAELAADLPYFEEFRAIRGQQAQALETEITRSCGTHANGDVGDNCATDTEAGPTAPPLPDSITSVVDIITDSRNSQVIRDALNDKSALGSDYAAKLATAIDGGLVLAARNGGAKPEALLPNADLVATGIDSGKAELLAAIEAEYAAIYALTVAAAYLDGNQRELAQTYADMHRGLRDLSLTLLTNSGEAAPTAPAGYDVIDNAADLREDTAAFLASQLGATSDAWRAVVQRSRQSQGRLFALQSGGIAIAHAAAMQGNGTAALPGLD